LIELYTIVGKPTVCMQRLPSSFVVRLGVPRHTVPNASFHIAQSDAFSGRSVENTPSLDTLDDEWSANTPSTLWNRHSVSCCLPFAI